MMVEVIDVLPWVKTRTRLGKWIDDNRKTEKWLADKSGVNKNTVTALCNDVDYRPHNGTRTKIIKALMSVDPNVSAAEFW
ncbi:XRE family transcriptional regulator [Paenibacillus planticolens]|uniref:XRE family transcriptional regulator n=1 Tax=Paenibacillus planticolens TaxID=2654976 RepID=A0ABX1ZE84_9BACL|nr:XRE family transcriptional regulator [Paenibacillus planticolens]NOU98411.1 XRE family transcriptional regulator [Paenibacillus planticolens]